MKWTPKLGVNPPHAIYSPCGRYRYTLSWPALSCGKGNALWILANPSTATEYETDPTVARAIRWTTQWGYQRCTVCNVRAWRETDPRKLPADPEAIGPDNEGCILACADYADIIVCGWGKLGGVPALMLADLLVERGHGAKLHCLRANQDGSPAHPLYLPGKLRPVAWRALGGAL